MTAHWGVPDPAAVEGTDDVKRKAFSGACHLLLARIRLFTSLPLAKLDRLELAEQAARDRQDVVTLPVEGAAARSEPSVPATQRAPLGFFERYLTVWVALCIVAGIALGQLAPGLSQSLGRMEVAHVNVPVGILIWAMIVPMLVKIDFAALHEVRRHARGIGVTLFINWAVKPFSMALLAWLFIRHLFAPLLPAGQIDSYIAGLILLAAAPCTAMVFVWSNLTDGEPNFTLTQVALNDTIMIFAFAPIVALLLGVSSIQVPWATLFLSVVIYILVPLVAGPGMARRAAAGEARRRSSERSRALRRSR